MSWLAHLSSEEKNPSYLILFLTFTHQPSVKDSHKIHEDALGVRGVRLSLVSVCRWDLRDPGEWVSEHGRAGLQVCCKQHKPQQDPHPQHHSHLRYTEDQPVWWLRGLQKRWDTQGQHRLVCLSRLSIQNNFIAPCPQCATSLPSGSSPCSGPLTVPRSAPSSPSATLWRSLTSRPAGNTRRWTTKTPSSLTCILNTLPLPGPSWTSWRSSNGRS